MNRGRTLRKPYQNVAADVPHSEQGCGNQGDHHEDHNSLQVNGITHVGTLGGHRGGNAQEGVECIDGRMKESKLAAFFKEAGFLCVFFHSNCRLCHFLYHLVDTGLEDGLDIVL